MIKYKELSDRIIGVAFSVYNELGTGFLEKVYENSLMVAFEEAQISAESQRKIDVLYHRKKVGLYYADIVVENKIILELKACREISENHQAQLLNYLKATGYELGYILNFGAKGKLEFKRLISHRF
jgi:GxxExxY protein